MAALVALSGAATASAATSSGTPYQDPSAIGSIGFCDRAGHQITHGTIGRAPFAWRAVSTRAAEPPYDGAGGTATLYAYQPRPGVPAGDWSGDQLTASSRYTNPAHPMAAATNGDDSLKAFMAAYAPMWDGMLQLRLFLGAPDQVTQSTSYPATSIQVTGKTWHVVNPVSVSCTSGKAVSLESIVLPKSSLAGKRHARQRQHDRAGHGQGSSGPAASGSPDQTGSLAASPAAAAAESGGGNGTGLTVGVIAGLLALGGAGLVAGRRRSQRSGAQS
jgi:hypothetical protein